MKPEIQNPILLYAREKKNSFPYHGTMCIDSNLIENRSNIFSLNFQIIKNGKEIQKFPISASRIDSSHFSLICFGVSISKMKIFLLYNNTNYTEIDAQSVDL